MVYSICRVLFLLEITARFMYVRYRFVFTKYEIFWYSGVCSVLRSHQYSYYQIFVQPSYSNYVTHTDDVICPIIVPLILGSYYAQSQGILTTIKVEMTLHSLDITISKSISSNSESIKYVSKYSFTQRQISEKMTLTFSSVRLILRSIG